MFVISGDLDMSEGILLAHGLSQCMGQSMESVFPGSCVLFLLYSLIKESWLHMFVTGVRLCVFAFVVDLNIFKSCIVDVSVAMLYPVAYFFLYA